MIILFLPFLVIPITILLAVIVTLCGKGKSQDNSRLKLKIYDAIYNPKLQTGESDNSIEKYKYKKKNSIVTQRELNFYKRLVTLLEKRCYIFPQAHLSCFLSHKIKNQNWKGALSHINGKSVDFILCEKDTLEPICAIELDDSTHDRIDRAERDKIVEAILKEAKVPLVRFRYVSTMTDKDILNAFGEAIKNVAKTE